MPFYETSAVELKSGGIAIYDKIAALCNLSVHFV